MAVNPIKLEIYKSLFMALCEEMGEVLRRSSFSPNIKERKDFSCALFNAKAEMIAQAAHIPVHLGSMGMAVSEAIKNMSLYPGDVIITNDPFLGGTHLPDITIITPLFLRNSKGAINRAPTYYLANRAHHADIGGSSPGSMPITDNIKNEGLYLSPQKLIQRGKLNQKLMKQIMKTARTPIERKGDITAQLSANKRGETRLKEILGKYGPKEVDRYMNHLLDYEEKLTRAVIQNLPGGFYYFEDFLDDDGFSKEPIRIALSLIIKNDEVTFNFSASSPQTKGPVNATRAITLACISYSLRCLMQTMTQASALSLRPIKLVTKKKTIVDAVYPRPVSGGNVETSQRIVDVILGALYKALPKKIPAASCGSMNNIAFGGFDPIRQRNFAYYETVGGGMGARSHADGLDGVHTHMTNTMNTPVEVLENEFPIRVNRYSYRDQSGGKGAYHGGRGLIRQFEFLAPAEVTLLTERRQIAPYGLAGGKDGERGVNSLIQKNKKRVLPSKIEIKVEPGDQIQMETPGGGGYGYPVTVK